ncbi:MAG: hypothetical protein ABIR24_12110 [Verrucomicrobiota bacterium]
MKPKFLAVLLFLNVLLFGVGFYFLNRVSSVIAPTRKSTSTVDFRERIKPTKSKVLLQKQIGAPPQKIVYVTNQFNWREVESSDYREYIAKLRGVGCPEATIKDIILTDILRLYAAQRGQFYHNGREFKFWETDEKRKLNAKQLEQREKQLAVIDKEIPSVLRELLGINYEREMNKYFVDTNEDERRLNFLPEEKRSQLLALREKIEGLRERVLEGAKGNPSATDLEALQKVEEQRKAELGKLLSGSELAEFELRMSGTADQLRADLIGFNPSESEFREIFELQRAVEEKFAYANANDEAAQKEKAVARKEVDEEIKRQLGDARYADYEKAQNPDYRNACVFTEVYELPTSTAQALFEIKQIAEAERQNLLANSALQEPDRLEALKAIQAETEKTLRATLGPKIFANYTLGTGKWVQNLGAN